MPLIEAFKQGSTLAVLYQQNHYFLVNIRQQRRAVPLTAHFIAFLSICKWLAAGRDLERSARPPVLLPLVMCVIVEFHWTREIPGAITNVVITVWLFPSRKLKLVEDSCCFLGPALELALHGVIDRSTLRAMTGFQHAGSKCHCIPKRDAHNSSLPPPLIMGVHLLPASMPKTKGKRALLFPFQGVLLSSQPAFKAKEKDELSDLYLQVYHNQLKGYILLVKRVNSSRCSQNYRESYLTDLLHLGLANGRGEVPGSHSPPQTQT